MRLHIFYWLFSFVLIHICFFSSIAQENKKANAIYITGSKFIEDISSSEKDYHLLYSYGNWCKPCLETFPKLMDIIVDNTNLAFYPLIVDKSKVTAENLEVLKSRFSYVGKSYAADISYGKKYYDQYKNFIAEIAPNHSEYGMSLILLFSKSGELLYATTWHQSIDEKVGGLKEILEAN